MISEIKKIKHKNIEWINISTPQEEHVKYLGKKFGFHHLDLEDCLSENQRSKIDEYDDYLFVVFHIPYIDKKTRRVEIEEIDVFIGEGFLITLHDGKLKILNAFFDKVKDDIKFRKESMGKGSGYFLYEILEKIFDSSFPLIDKLEKSLNLLEKDVFKLEAMGRRDMLKEILLLKKDIIVFRRVVLPQRTVVAQLEHKPHSFMRKLGVYFDNVVDKIEKMWSNLENLKELVLSLQETNESIISHNTNNIIKILTVFSVIMLPLSVITGFYGMNVQGLPFAGSLFASGFISLGMFLVVVLMLLFFRFKRWL